MLSINKAKLLTGLKYTLYDNDYKVIDGFFGGRFHYDRRYRVFAIAGTCGYREHIYGIIGGHMFLFEILERDTNYKPIEFRISLLNGTDILNADKDKRYSNLVIKRYE